MNSEDIKLGEETDSPEAGDVCIINGTHHYFEIPSGLTCPGIRLEGGRHLFVDDLKMLGAKFYKKYNPVVLTWPILMPVLFLGTVQPLETYEIHIRIPHEHRNKQFKITAEEVVE